MKVYVSNYLSKSISIIEYPDINNHKQIYLEQDIYPHHFCVDKKSNIIYIPSSSDGVLYLLDLETNKIIDFVSIGGSLSQISICDNEIFISNEDSNSIYILDKQNLYPVGMIGVDNMPHGFDYDMKNKKIYVPSIDSISCIDIKSKSICNRIYTDYKCWHITVDHNSNNIYVSSLDGNVLIVDKDTLNISKIINEFLIPVEVCLNHKKNKVYVADLGYKQIKILDYYTNNIIGKIYVDGNPQGLCLSNDSNQLFVSDTLKNKIKVYDTDTDELINEINTGKEPTTIVCL